MSRRSAFSVTQQEASWIASLSMLGAWLGAMIGDWIMRRGRRLALRVTSLPLAMAWILTGVAPCVELVYVTSFIGGLCCSVITMVAQVEKSTRYIDCVCEATLDTDALRERISLYLSLSLFDRYTYRKSRCQAYADVCRRC